MLINGREVLLYTPHGSYLYGLATGLSDKDFYAVVADRPVNKYGDAKQTIVNNVDTTVVGYSKFLEMCRKGVPQALEALMSQQATLDNIGFIRENYVIAGSEVLSTYLRTIKSFTLDEREGKQPKFRRHAVRLALNLHDIVAQGRFNPELTEAQKATCQRAHLLPLEQLKEELNKISGYHIF